MDILDQYLGIQLRDKHLIYSIVISKIRGEVKKSLQNVPDGAQNIQRIIFLKNAIS